LHRIKVLQERGINEVEADIFEMNDVEALEANISTAIARGRANPVEVGKIVSKLLQEGKTIEEVSKLFGKNKKWVEVYSVIGEMEPKYQDALSRGKLSVGVIEAALELEDENEIRLALDYAILYGYKIPEMKNYVRHRKEELEIYRKRMEAEKLEEYTPPTPSADLAFRTKCSLCENEYDSRYMTGAVICPNCKTLFKMIYATFPDFDKAFSELQKLLAEYKERQEYERLKKKFEGGGSQENNQPSPS
jgi:hypothetical protein